MIMHAFPTSFSPRDAMQAKSNYQNDYGLTNCNREKLYIQRADLLFTHKLVFGIIDLKLSQISIEQAAAPSTNYTRPFAKAA